MTPDRKQLEAELVQFVQSRGARHAAVTSSTDLLDSVLLDSLLLMDLIFHIEELYGVRFEGDHVNPANFRTIAAIVNFVLTNCQNQSGNRTDCGTGRAVAGPWGQYDYEVAITQARNARPASPAL